MTTHDENDLRAALNSLALDDGREPDLTAFRSRLITLTSDEPAHGTVLEILPAEIPRLRPRRRTMLIAAAAACVAILAGLLTALLPRDGSTAPAGVSDAFLSNVRESVLPGTTWLETRAGRGSATLAVPAHSVPTNYSLAVYVTCSGYSRSIGFNEAVRVGLASGQTNVCRGGINGLSLTEARVDTVHLDIDARASWQLAIVIEHDLRTNAGVEGPDSDRDASFRDAARRPHEHPGYFAGTGSRSISTGLIASSPGDSGYVISLRCTGTGVTLPGASSAEDVGSELLYTRTCFAGRTYIWNSVRLPSQGLRVDAPEGTRWQLLISGQ